MKSLLRGLLIVATMLLASAANAATEARERLTIGITQFPSTFHPNIDSMLAKSYVLGKTRRPITVYDAFWSLVF